MENSFACEVFQSGPCQVSPETKRDLGGTSSVIVDIFKAKYNRNYMFVLESILYSGFISQLQPTSLFHHVLIYMILYSNPGSLCSDSE